jgi:hypothetical protein
MVFSVTTDVFSDAIVTAKEWHESSLVYASGTLDELIKEGKF